MLRVQPIEFLRKDSDHYVARCQTFDDRGPVEFVFPVETNESNIGEPRQIKQPDSFFFVTHDDNAGWSLVTGIAHFDKFCATINDTNCVVFGLPSAELPPTVLRLAGDSGESRSYEVLFGTGDVSIALNFVVTGRGNRRSVSFKNKNWMADLQGNWWKLDGTENTETLLVESLIYFDFARTLDYTDAQLEERSEKILWDAIFAQSEKNDEWRRQMPARKPLP